MSPLPADLGEGAVVRRLTMSDLAAVWALVDAERSRLEPWMPWIDGTRTIEDQRRWLETPSVEIRAGVRNTRSRAIPERLGFVQEGIERGAERGSRGFYDVVVYSMLEDEWPRT